MAEPSRLLSSMKPPMNSCNPFWKISSIRLFIRRARTVRARLQNSRIEEIFQTGLHEFIDNFVEDNNQLGTATAQQYLL